MKWISPALAPTAALAPALVLALLPAGIVSGQSTTSRLDQLAPGPIAEVSSGSRSTPNFGSDALGGDLIIQPPPINPLPGDDPAGAFTPSRAADGSSGASSFGGFTLPRTPAVSSEYLKKNPSLQPPALPTTRHFSQPAFPAKKAGQPESEDHQWGHANTAPDVCACGSNELAPDNCQCDACLNRSATDLCNSGCSDGGDLVSVPCDPCEADALVAGDCGCDECGDVGCSDCSAGYYETHDQGFDHRRGREENRTIKQGPLVSHFKKHHQKKEHRHRDDRDDYVCQSGTCEDQSYDDSCTVVDQHGHSQCEATDNVYQPVVANPRNPDDVYTNTMFNVSGVFFNRNMPNVPLSVERVAPGGTPSRFLSSGDADHGNFGGIDASLVRRRATGKGIELRYLNLTPGEATTTFPGSPLTVVSQFGQIGQAGGITHQQAFNLADVHEVTRDMTIQNAEFNLLRMGRQASTRRGQDANFEYLLGFRYFKFEESLQYSGFAIRPNTAAGGDISQADYRSEVENELFGAQFGGRSEISLFHRLSFLVGLKAGIFQNNLSSRQQATTRGIGGEQRIAEVLNGPNQGARFDLSGEDTDYTLLGELDLGLTYRVTNSIRLRGGYKAIFVDDIAFADNQIGADFRNIAANSVPQANDDLVLYGGYFGIDFAF